MVAFYNEIDPFAADWLEKLIDAGQIAWGVVDRRSIEDIRPSELAGFTQVHFFAGIGVWSYALRQAGWADDRPVWTGSCPCQPFSTAGKGNGFADERHVWPAMHWLVEQCRPNVIFGEQVSSKDGLAWLDLVQTDLEATGYAFGALDLCAAGVGAPHIRQRSYWMAHDSRKRIFTGGFAPIDGTKEGMCRANGKRQWVRANPRPSGPGIINRRDDDDDTRSQGYSGDDGGSVGQWQGTERPTSAPSVSGGLADSKLPLGREVRLDRENGHHGKNERWQETHGQSGTRGEICSARPTNGQWGNADWLHCRDGKWRPVESGTFPLVNGATNRVGRLRGYGNAIVAPLAQEFIETAMDWL